MHVLLVSTETPVKIYGLTSAYDLQAMLFHMSANSPLPLRLRWSVCVGNHADMLLRVLQMKYKPGLIHHHWYSLGDKDVHEIQGITSKNYVQVIDSVTRFALQIRKELHPEDYVTLEPPPRAVKPAPTPDDLEAQREKILQGLKDLGL